MKRREFVNATVAAGALAATGAGILSSGRVYAARPDEAFLATDRNEAMKIVFGTTEAEDSADIKVDAPLQAENGAVVPVSVAVNVPNPELIAIIIDKNPTPLLTVFEPTAKSGTFFSLRVKMAGTDKVHAYVKAGGKILHASQEVRVAVGGCGG